ncbi:hypothetical protein [Bartonella sp. CL266QHHD]|uniref:hypothetical protein n=1 Tax=Bartonella sp. CL266QHHD TaxID=3243519 RepID=UPI0035CECA9A
MPFLFFFKDGFAHYLIHEVKTQLFEGGDLKRMSGQWWKLARQAFEFFTDRCL